MGAHKNSHRVSSGLSLSSEFYLRQFYKSNPQLTKDSRRKQLSKLELSYEDSKALRTGSTFLSKGKYSDDDNTESIANQVKAYVKTYNNTVAAAKSDRSFKRYSGQLKELANKYSDELKSVGISMERDGSLKLNENLLKYADNDRLKKVFSKDAEMTVKVSSIARKLNNTSRDIILAQITGAGKSINISL